MKLLKKVSFAGLIRYATAFAAFVCFSKLWNEPSLIPLALLSAFLYFDFSPVITPLLYLGATAIMSVGLLPTAAIGGAFLTAVFLIYHAAGGKPKAELFIYQLAALIPYFLMSADGLYQKIAVGALSAALLATAIPALKCIIVKGLKYKPEYEELIGLAITTVMLGVGVANVFSVAVWKCLSAFIILFATYLYRIGMATTVAALLGVSAAVYNSDLSYIGLFVVWALLPLSVMKTSRYLAAVLLPAADFFMMRLFNIDPNYGIFDVLFTVGGALAFCLVPARAVQSLKEKLFSFRERQLVRQTVNRSRYILSNRLYEISDVFTEISDVLTSLKKDAVSDDAAKKHLITELRSNVCAECDNSHKCRTRKVPSEASLDKLLNIGLAKGKVSFVDIPADITAHCVHANNMIFCINRLLAEYRSYMLEALNYDKSKQLIAGQAQAVAEVLKGLAFETGQTLKYRNNLERKLSDRLAKAGINVTELMLYGEASELTVSMILAGTETPLTDITKAVSAAVGEQMSIYERALIQEEKCFVLLKKSAKFDAVFGVSSVCKNGSPKCGDTHSVERLKGDKFLVALSDGMGSGDYAETVSDASLSLIESFYKAGMNSRMILGTVNKLLAINTEDSFAALDICVFDLNELTADFIKFGAPYGFVITADGIKIVEGNCLPLGILDELKPSVTSDQLSAGDMLVFVTDGISDAFKSSSELIDFLRDQPSKNPQTLCEDVVSEALRLSNGTAYDDMTCLAVRVFERKTA